MKEPKLKKGQVIEYEGKRYVINFMISLGFYNVRRIDGSGTANLLQSKFTVASEAL